MKGRGKSFLPSTPQGTTVPLWTQCATKPPSQPSPVQGRALHKHRGEEAIPCPSISIPALLSSSPPGKWVLRSSEAHPLPFGRKTFRTPLKALKRWEWGCHVAPHSPQPQFPQFAQLGEMPPEWVPFIFRLKQFNPHTVKAV